MGVTENFKQEAWAATSYAKFRNTKKFNRKQRKSGDRLIGRAVQKHGIDGGLLRIGR